MGAPLLSAFCSPWAFSWHGVPGDMSLGWNSGRVPGSCSSCRQVLRADGAFLRGCGKSKASVHSLLWGPCVHRAIPEGCHSS